MIESTVSRPINPDDYLETAGGRLWTPERSRNARRFAFAELQARLRSPGRWRVVVVCGIQGSGKSSWIARQELKPDLIYFDAALPGARHRRPVIDMARENGATAECVWVCIPLEMALARNSARSPDKVVPEASLRSVATLFEAPSILEGFERVTRVDANTAQIAQ